MSDGDITKSIKHLHPLVLAIIIDVLKVIPYVDCIFTVYLQIILWREMLNSEYLQWLNICYDLSDFPGMVGPFVDVFPLNTLTVLIMMFYNKIPYNI